MSTRRPPGTRSGAQPRRRWPTWTSRCRTGARGGWRIGFNVAGNSVSLLNGGKDFSRWVPHGRALYRLFKLPVERALGRGGSGMADVAIAECELESSLDGDYGAAMNGICRSMTGVSDDPEMRCAAIGIQSRIMMARGDLEEARELMRKHIDALPPDAPKRLRQNLEVYRLTLGLMAGDTAEAMDWLELSAPDEQQDFIILDRYRYMLKLRLYIIKAQWSKTRLLAAQLATYFEQYDRPYMRIQLHLMQAVIDWRQGMEEWRGEMEKALLLGRRYRLVRVIADEGIAVTDMLSEMKLPEDEWARGVVRLTREQAARHPYYLRSIAETPVLTSREYQVYSLLVAGYSNAEIGKLLNLTERTVKHYLTLIYKKLGVRSRAEALARHAEQGDL